MIRLGRRELAVFFSGKTRAIKEGDILLRIKPNSRNLKRFAFIVSGPKKSAAARNLTRRRLNEIIRDEIREIPPGWDMVFSVRLSTKKAFSFSELKKDAKDVLHKAGF